MQRRSLSWTSGLATACALTLSACAVGATRPPPRGSGTGRVADAAATSSSTSGPGIGAGTAMEQAAGAQDEVMVIELCGEQVVLLPGTGGLDDDWILEPPAVQDGWAEVWNDGWCAARSWADDELVEVVLGAIVGHDAETLGLELDDGHLLVLRLPTPDDPQRAPLLESLGLAREGERVAARVRWNGADPSVEALLDEAQVRAEEDRLVRVLIR